MSRRTWVVVLALSLGACGGLEPEWEAPEARGKAESKGTTKVAAQVVHYYTRIIRNTRKTYCYLPRDESRRELVHVLDFGLFRAPYLVDLGLKDFERDGSVLVAEAASGDIIEETLVDVGCGGDGDGMKCISAVKGAVKAFENKDLKEDKRWDAAMRAYLAPEDNVRQVFTLGGKDGPSLAASIEDSAGLRVVLRPPARNSGCLFAEFTLRH